MDHIRKSEGHTQLIYALAVARRRGPKHEVTITQEAAEVIVNQFRKDKHQQKLQTLRIEKTNEQHDQTTR